MRRRYIITHMDTDKSFEALFKPGLSDCYFDINAPSPMQIGDTSFNLWNAWWLAELSRLIYREDKHNTGKKKLALMTSEILGKVNLQLIKEFTDDKTSTYALLIKTTAIHTHTREELPCLIFVFCGTCELHDWKINFRAYQREFYDNGKVHRGFQKAFLAIKDELFAHGDINEYPLFITGHSLGAAIATLSCACLANTAAKLDSCYTFGSPRVGNPEFVQSIPANKIYRVINHRDSITRLPIDIKPFQYKHAGTPCFINNDNELKTGMSEEEIYQQQQLQISQLGEINQIEKLLKKLYEMKRKLPSFLSDHAPVNYVAKLKHILVASDEKPPATGR